jgi:hypothetical protein
MAPPDSGHDAVFRPQKFLQRLGQHSGQFLPGQQLQPTTENTASDRPHDRIPVLDQIRPPCIAKNAERSARRTGSEHPANQLITGDDIAGHHQFSRFENFLQVLISRNHSCRCRPRGTSHFGGARRWSQINASPIASEAIERIGQFYGICFRIQTIEFRCADEAVDRRPALSVGIGACEQSDPYCNTS